MRIISRIIKCLSMWSRVLTIAVVCAQSVGCECIGRCKARENLVPWYTQQELIEIVSEPPGARIEVNGEYVGDAPLVVWVTRGGIDGMAKSLAVQAVPKTTGHFEQLRLVAMGESTPKRIFFDMRTVQ